MQKFTTDQSTESQYLWSAEPQMGYLYQHFPQGSMTIPEEEMKIL